MSVGVKFFMVNGWESIILWIFEVIGWMCGFIINSIYNRI